MKNKLPHIKTALYCVSYHWSKRIMPYSSIDIKPIRHYSFAFSKGWGFSSSFSKKIDISSKGTVLF